MRYSVTVERGGDGACLAWVDELPGCFVRSSSRDEVESRLPAAIGDFLRWAGEPSGGDIEVEIAEEVESAIATQEDTEALVGVDREPLTSADWRRLDAWLVRSREELFELVSDLSDEDLDREVEPGGPTVREELRHVAFVEIMYAAWTFDLNSGEGLAGFLDWTREATRGRLRELAEQGSDALTYAEWDGAPRPEPWTPRKAARRLLWHERVHARAIRGETAGAG